MSDGLEGLPAHSLWDRAYDALAVEDKKNVLKYEDVVLKGLLKDEHEDAPSHPLSRRDKLDTISKLGLKRIEEGQLKVSVAGRDVKLREAVAGAAKAVKGLVGYAKDAVGDVPYAAIVIAGVSLVLPLLTNLSTTEAANHEGFARVTEKMEYYINMESLLLGGDMEPGLRSTLEKRLVAFYSKIIDFQVRSVLRFYRNRAKNLVRSAVNYDSWDKKLQAITEDEADLASKLDTTLSARRHQQQEKQHQQQERQHQQLERQNQHLEVLVEKSNVGERIDALAQVVSDRFQDVDDRFQDAGDRACLHDLHATNPANDKTRIEELRGGLLADAYRWVLGNTSFVAWRACEESKLLWVRGDPGKGKTMILCGLIDELQAEVQAAPRCADGTSGPLLAYFFCQASDDRINSAMAVLRGLLFMLVDQRPALISHLRRPYDLEGAKLFTDPNAWISLTKIFRGMLDSMGTSQTVYIVLDALDECGSPAFDDGQLMRLLSFLVDTVASAKVRVKCIMSSRNWPAIEEGMRRRKDAKTTQVPLNLEVNKDAVSKAIDTYIAYKVDELAQVKEYDDAIKLTVTDYLKAHAGGTFLWVALVCGRLASPEVPRWQVEDVLKESPTELSELYQRMLLGIEKSVLGRRVFLQLLAFVTLAARPVSLAELMTLLRRLEKVSSSPADHVGIVKACGSFLTLRSNTVYWVHQSARDFFQDKKEASDRIYPAGVKQEHGKLFRAALGHLKDTLRRNIADLPGFGTVVGNQRVPDALRPVQYSTVSWADHLLASLAGSDGPLDAQDAAVIYKFFRAKFLNWLEALGLLGGLPSGIFVLTKLRGLSDGVNERLRNFVADAYRFVLFFQTGIAAAPLQVYASALVFSPKSSIVYQTFKGEAPDWALIRTSKPVEWGSRLHMLEGHESSVTSIAFSPDGRHLASGAMDTTVKIWDVALGSCLHTLEGHKGRVTSVSFSPSDGKYIASGSDDGTIRIWDAASNRHLHTLQSHTKRVESITFAPSGDYLAAATTGSIQIWDVVDFDECLHIQQAYLSTPALAFAPDGKTLAFLFFGDRMQFCNMASGVCTHASHIGQDLYADVFALSPDGKHAAIPTGADGHMLTIWDIESEKCMRTIGGHKNHVKSIAYSSDGRRLVSSSVSEEVKVWNVVSGTCTHTFMSTWGGSPVTFSPDGALLAATSYSGVAIWDTMSDLGMDAVEAIDGTFAVMVYSPDGTRAASGSMDGTLRLWDAASGTCTRVLERSTLSVSAIAFSLDATQVASSALDCVQVWDADSGTLVCTLEHDAERASCLAFSADGRFIVSGFADNTGIIWNIASKDCTKLLEGSRAPVLSAAFSPDGRLVASGSEDGTVQIWDAASGVCLHSLVGHTSSTKEVAFSSDNVHIVSGSADGSAKVWNVASGACTHTFTGYPRTQIARLAQSLVRVDDLEDGKDFTQQLRKIDPTALLLTFNGDDLSWAAYNEEVVLWLPSEFRPISWDRRGQIAFICTAFGQMYFLALSEIESVHAQVRF